MPGDTSLNDDSTILATMGMAPTVSGTMLAFVPMDEPVTSLVNGMSKTRRIRKGSDLDMLTINPTIKLTPLFESIRSFADAYKTMPSGSPPRYARTDAKNVIVSVSNIPFLIASMIYSLMLCSPPELTAPNP